ncbi:unnamed protein product [Ophioblennius macclurei]
MSGCRIFIGRLSPSAREKDVERFFKGYGRIRDIDLKRGFGFVEFDDPRDAEDAVYELDGKELCNERVTIEHARVRLRGGRGRGGGGGGGRFSDRYGRGSQNSRSRNPPPMRTENRLIVENLSSRVSWQVSTTTSLSLGLGTLHLHTYRVLPTIYIQCSHIELLLNNHCQC